MRPKPMIEIGGRPILWHIMKMYSHHGINDFIICCGYKGAVVKEFFASYALHSSDVTFDLRRNTVQVHQNDADNWRVTVVDTGEATQTGGRLRRVRRFVEDAPAFCFTYGDAVSDLDLGHLIAFHHGHGRQATVTAVQPVARFGRLVCDGADPIVRAFEEKPPEHSWVSGGFFVLSPRVIDTVSGDDAVWEQEPMRALVAQRELAAYRYSGFWQCMDTQRDRLHLEHLWQHGAPWRKW